MLRELTGLKDPVGECVDAAGDVYIAEFRNETVLEYRRGHKTPIASFATDGYTLGCSVNQSGDLAVGNFDSPSFGQGDIEVFPHGGGSPQRYTSSNCYDMSAPGYDNHGNLYVEATDGDQTFVCELPAGANALRTVSVSAKITTADSVMWDGKYLTLTDGGYHQTNQTAIERATESGSGNLTIVSVTQLRGNCDGAFAAVTDPFIVGEKNTPVNDEEGQAVIGINAWCNRFGNVGTDIWSYPQGGAPIAKLPSGYASEGESVSIAK